MYFDESGRCTTKLTSHEVYHKSRSYFQIDETLKQKIDLKQIYNNLHHSYSANITTTYEIFLDKINNLKNKINKDEKLKNINNGISIPFIIPKLIKTDIGNNIQEIFIPSLEKSYKKIYPDYEFKNHCSEDLLNKITYFSESKYGNFLKKSEKEEIVGLYFPCMNEFSFPAALETIKKMPFELNLSGGYEILSSLIGMPNLLFRKEKYPPLLWFSSLRNVENDKIGYHIEPYGYNLTFNRRAHLDQAAEYWWHSITICL